jgi:hypothetical protein
MADVKSEHEHREEIQKLCATLKTMGRFKVYGNDAKTEKLSFWSRKEYATEQGNEFVVDCLRKIGFTNVQNNKEKNSFHAVSATIVCEYDLSQCKIQNANPKDLQALCYMFEFMKIWCTVFLPDGQGGRFELPYYKHLAHLRDYLHQHSSVK